MKPDEFMDLNNLSEFIGDMFYKKIKNAILNNWESASIFVTFPTDKDPSIQGVIFKLEKPQFSSFLTSYLKKCEVDEKYEVCSDIISTINILESSDVKTK